MDADPTSSETVVSELHDVSLIENLLKTPARGKKNTTQSPRRTRSPTMEVVIARSRPAKKPELPLSTVDEMEVDELMPDDAPPSTPKKRVTRPRGKQIALEADEGAVEPSKATSTRSTRARKGPQAKPTVISSPGLAEELQQIQISQRVTRNRGTPAKPSRRTVSEFVEPPGEVSDAGYEEILAKPHSNTSGDHSAPNESENDYRSLFGDEEETEKRDNGADMHTLQTRGLPPTSSTCLPLDLQPSFIACQKAVIKNLTKNSLVAQPETSPNSIAIQELSDLIDGTVHRAEGNSCLVLGPRGSGKSTVRSQ